MNERREDLELQIVQVLDSECPALNQPDLVVEAFHESEGDLVIGVAIGGDAIPMALDHGGEILKGL